jgi:filamentous hemagglutinin
LSANKLSNTNSTSALREQVLANVRENQSAREASNFGIYIAKEAQIKAGFNADQWGMVKIPKGSIIYGGHPDQSNYYTGLSTIEQSAYNKASLWESLQVRPHPTMGLRNQIAMYQVNDDIIVASGDVLANPQYGAGGGIQFFVRSYQKSLTLLDIIDLY